MRPRLAVAAALLASTAAHAATADAADRPSGELRLRWDDRQPSTQGPLADANRIAPGFVAPTPSALVAQAWGRATQRLGPAALTAELFVAQQRSEHGAVSGVGRVDELYAALDRDAWQLSAGKKVVGWDVGYGFRPNDVVQQERRRTLLPERLEGRAVVEAEHFSADEAWTLVAVQAQRWSDSPDSTRGADESAIAARAYRRFGSTDAFAFARWGRHTGWSLGAAAAWVVGDSLELHATARALHAHDGWTISEGAGSAPQTANAWSRATMPGGTQWLLGSSWTGEAQQGVLVELWHDGTTLSDRQWDDWLARNRALAGSAAPAAARAGNLAWQATPLDSPNLRRDNVYVRLSWQPNPWLFAVDALFNPADHGRLWTASLQWQGDRWRIDAALRLADGPANSLMRQIPTGRSASVAATWAW